MEEVGTLWERWGRGGSQQRAPRNPAGTRLNDAVSVIRLLKLEPQLQDILGQVPEAKSPLCLRVHSSKRQIIEPHL